jgi:hypothetical protein
MKHSVRSHCAGDNVVPGHIQSQIAQVIQSVSVKPRRGGGTRIRDAIITGFKAFGWSGKFLVAKGSNITITSMHEGVGLCVQTGNVARMYADLIKLQTLYLDNAIRSAAIIVPSKPVARLLGSNLAQANRLERELEIFKKAYNVPTLIFALE